MHDKGNGLVAPKNEFKLSWKIICSMENEETQKSQEIFLYDSKPNFLNKLIYSYVHPFLGVDEVNGEYMGITSHWWWKWWFNILLLTLTRLRPSTNSCYA